MFSVRKQDYSFPPLEPTPPLTPNQLTPLSPSPHMHRSQECFLFSVLSLTRTHLSLVAPLGPSCVHMACGSQVKPLRTLLFKLIDSQVPPALDQVRVMSFSLLLFLPLLFLLSWTLSFPSCSSVHSQLQVVIASTLPLFLSSSLSSSLPLLLSHFFSSFLSSSPPLSLSLLLSFFLSSLSFSPPFFLPPTLPLFSPPSLPLPLSQVTSEALEVGSSVLLPPILDRLDLLLSILPEVPSLLTSLTTGQVAH